MYEKRGEISMNSLVYLNKDEAMTDSIMVSEYFHKRHDRVLRKIEQIKNDSPQKWGQCFRASHYKDASGKNNIKYLMNRDGFSFLVMGFTGQKANQWKWDYIKAFNTMETIIKEKTTQEWIETRKFGKLTRKAETDGIKDFIEYALSQGSEHADKYYMIFSSLANKLAGVKKRDSASTIQLNNLAIYENIILQVIQEGIRAGLPYKTIYQNCKNRCEQAKEIALLA